MSSRNINDIYVMLVLMKDKYIIINISGRVRGTVGFWCGLDLYQLVRLEKVGIFGSDRIGFSIF